MKNCVLSVSALLLCTGLGAGEPFPDRGGCAPSGPLGSFGYREITQLASWDGLQPTRFVYVDASAPLGGNGTSWANAYQSLHDALNTELFASGIVEIRIAGGFYRADRVNGVNTMDPDLTYNLARLNGISPNLSGLKRIAGGYAGRQSANPDERDLTKYPTVFNGDLLGNDTEKFENYSDNTKVMFDTPFASGIVDINGITIEHARVGVRGVRWMTDCTIRWCDASGDDLPVSTQEASPVIFADGRMVGCTFHNNRTGTFGGAVKISGRSVIANCRFIANNARAGGAIASTFQEPAEVVIQNSFFSGNSSSGISGGTGAVIYNSAFLPAATQLVHCTIVGNWVEDGGGYSVLSTAASSSIQNSILDQNYSFAGSSSETEIFIPQPNFGQPNIIEANVFHRFNQNIQADPNLPRIRLNSEAASGFISLLGPDGIIGTIDDDPSLGFNAAAIGHSVNRTTSPPAWGLDTGFFDIADLDGDCDVTEPIPVDIFGNPRAVETVPGEGIDGNAADAGCVEFIPSPDALPSQPWVFTDPVITDFSPDPIRFYVDAKRPDGGDGLSWATAFTSPSQALDIAGMRAAPVEIWVAAGEYAPTTERSGILSFRMLKHVTMLGGFAGNESNESERDWVTNVTVLTGDVLRDDNVSLPATLLDNAQHLVTSLGPRGGGVLDGFTLQDGSPYASPFGPGLFWAADNGLGGGRVGGLVYLGAGDLYIRNCNLGPASFGYTNTGPRAVPFIATRGQDANLHIEQSRIVYDARNLDLQEALVPRIIHDSLGRVFTPRHGAGHVNLTACDIQIYNGGTFIGAYNAGPIEMVRSRVMTDYTGSPVVNQLLFVSSPSPITLSDSVVIADSIGLRGPDVRVSNSTFMGDRFVVNSTGPLAGRSIQLRNSVIPATWTSVGVQPEVSGTVFANNINPSILSGYGPTNTTFDFENNAAAFFLDPLGPDGIPFTGDEDLRLAPGSPAINTGLNEFVTSDFDLDGNPRIVAHVVDRGAYEFTGTCTGDVNGDGEVNLGDLNLVLANFGQPLPFGDASGDGHVNLADLNIILAAFGQTCTP